MEQAATLFAARGISAVSIRDIAAAARVNHGLVHRHFGSKDGLVGATMARLVEQVRAGLSRVPAEAPLRSQLAAAMTATDAGDRHWRILARSLLDGDDPRRLQSEFPVVARLLETARRDHPDQVPEARIVLATAAALGLLLFDEYLRVATDSADAWPAVRASALRLLADTVAPSDDSTRQTA